MVGGQSGVLRVFSVMEMTCLQEFDGLGRYQSPIHSLTLTSGEMHLLVGLENGMLCISTLDAEYLRQRLQRKLADLGF